MQELLQSGIFTYEHRANPIMQSSFVQVMINLHDLLQKCKLAGVRVDFTDAVNITPVVSDVTDLVAQVRHAAAHLTAPQRRTINNTEIVYFQIWGKAEGLNIGDKIFLDGEYDDDMCFIYGAFQLYLNRHIIAALNTAIINLRPIIQHSSFNFVRPIPYLYIPEPAQ